MTPLKTNFPEETGEFKVVQAEMDGNQYLWFVKSSLGHSICLTLLLEREGNRFGWYKGYEEKPLKMTQDRVATSEELADILTYETVQDLADPDIPGLEKPEIPALQGQGYRVIGMGKALIDKDKRTVVFSGQSMSYGIRINIEQLTLARQSQPVWQITFDDRITF